MWAVSIVLALVTSCGSLATLSIVGSCASEESNVELTELVNIEVDAEEKIVENRERRIRRRSIAVRRSDRGQLQKPSKAEVAAMPLPFRSRLNGCGSHLRI